LRDRYEEFAKRGADVVAIGMGVPEMAADFRDKQDIPFRLLVDNTKETYRVLEMKKGSLLDVVGPGVWLRGARGILSGKGAAMPKQDPYQMGGAVVVDKGGEVKFVHRGQHAPDTAPVDKLLAALK
jgi:peroxiredoxin